MSLITCRDVTLAYENQTVISHLNFEVHSGDYLCIVGENGSGKSTLMKALLHLKHPTAGEIALGEGLKASEIGYLPQQTPVQKDFPASVYEVVKSGCLNSLGWHPFYGHDARRMAREQMKRLGIEAIAQRCYRELSGGQQQRVLLARALCATKKVLLLDEPTAGLDPLVTKELYELIEQINREMEITIIMVSHDIQSAVGSASHILHLQENSAYYGTTEAYVNSRAGKDFLGGEKRD